MQKIGSQRYTKIFPSIQTTKIQKQHTRVTGTPNYKRDQPTTHVSTQSSTTTKPNDARHKHDNDNSDQHKPDSNKLDRGKSQTRQN
jgi:hypothetical protein